MMLPGLQKQYDQFERAGLFKDNPQAKEVARSAFATVEETLTALVRVIEMQSSVQVPLINCRAEIKFTGNQPIKEDYERLSLIAAVFAGDIDWNAEKETPDAK